MDIDKMTLSELKELAYDQMVILQQTQTNLQVINNRIQEKKKGTIEEEVV
jgi:hypothetical protein